MFRLTVGAWFTFSCTLTCQLGGEAERGTVPGPAGDLVPRQTVVSSLQPIEENRSAIRLVRNDPVGI